MWRSNLLRHFLKNSLGLQNTFKEISKGKDGWDIENSPFWSRQNHREMIRKQQLDDYNKDLELECSTCNRVVGNNDSRFNNG